MIPIRQVQAIIDGEVLSSNAEIFISADKHSSTSDLRPDIGIHLSDYPKYRTAQSRTKKLGPEKAFNFVTTALAIEVKFSASDDPFVDNFSVENPFENKTQGGFRTRGQMAKYSEETLWVQHRCFIYQIIIFDRWARIYRWDRSGAIVTARFDYVANPNFLGQFLWGFCHKDRAGQGLDPTVSHASVVERAAFERAIKQATEANEGVSDDVDPLDKRYPICKMMVSDGDRLRPYIVGRPSHVAPGPCGRGTRVYHAYDLEDRKVKILKDFWGVHHEDRMPEWEVYAELEAHSVPSVLKMTCGGFVESFDNIQVTKTQVVAGEFIGGHTIYGCIFDIFYHGRLVQDLAFEAQHLRNSEEYVRMLLDVLEGQGLLLSHMPTLHSHRFTGIAKAHDAGILHRDITFGNVLFFRGNNGQVHGFLNDWDHAAKIEQHGSFLPSRSVCGAVVLPFMQPL